MLKLVPGPFFANELGAIQHNQFGKEWSGGMSTNGNIPNENNGPRRSGKYLTFELASAPYGIELSRVREIVGMLDLKPTTDMPAYVRGQFTLRGQTIPVIDLRQKLSLPAGETSEETCILIVRTSGRLLGLQVDKVTEVLFYADEQIENAQPMSAPFDSSYIIGLGNALGRTSSLLNVDRMLSEVSKIGPAIDLFEPHAR